MGVVYLMREGKYVLRAKPFSEWQTKSASWLVVLVVSRTIGILDF